MSLNKKSFSPAFIESRNNEKKIKKIKSIIEECKEKIKIENHKTREVLLINMMEEILNFLEDNYK
ncbi:hypothetical protein [Aliarcobacter lanthieri]|uniref:hypothetical protein n=1 Tax=Aliarcobacter lanthieri TaxID=1355374 RepID=UPI003AAD319D